MPQSVSLGGAYSPHNWSALLAMHMPCHALLWLVHKCSAVTIAALQS